MPHPRLSKFNTLSLFSYIPTALYQSYKKIFRNRTLTITNKVFTMIRRLCLCALLVPACFSFILDTVFGPPPQTVQQLDVEKYLGRWYQMYASQSVVTLWESGAVCVTADYEKGDNGRITVLNSERLKGGNGTLKVIHGYAIPSNDPGKLSVHLETVPVNAAYWVLKLGPATWGPDKKYQYAVVSDNVRGTLFVLARDPVVFQRDYQAEVLTFLQDQGFTTFYNKPLNTYHGPDCVYNKDHH